MSRPVTTEYKLLELDRSGATTTVWLNRPEKFNALSVELMTEIEQVARSFLVDEVTRVVVFRGHGKHFSAGAD